MKIEKVTMTGADNSTQVNDLFEIAKQYPFVEFGILLSRKSQGTNRFPDRMWLDTLQSKITYNVNLAAHLCGSYVRELLMGNTDFVYKDIGLLWGRFDRIQINTHGIKHEFDHDKLRAIITKYHLHTFIFQYDDVNQELWEAVKDLNNVAFLFDLSHGEGVVPESWPEPIEGKPCGYAGGLGPDNIVEQLEKIRTVYSAAMQKQFQLPHTWIDMETKIRSNNDQLFDLEKVKQVLQVCQESGLIF